MRTFLLSGLLITIFVVGACRTPKSTAVVEPTANRTLSANAMKGQELFNQNCGRCHDLPVVADYSSERWDRIVPSMSKKAHLDAEQEASVMAYVKETLN